ncbi:DUF3149 domain-containing protein [Alteromonas sp. a30]|nr:DUF3149 domain-containing protein [Alteromonas sp. a30]
MLLNDPVVWGSLLGVGIVVAICGYFVWYFLDHIAHSDQEKH